MMVCARAGSDESCCASVVLVLCDVCVHRRAGRDGREGRSPQGEGESSVFGRGNPPLSGLWALKSVPCGAKGL